MCYSKVGFWKYVHLHDKFMEVAWKSLKFYRSYWHCLLLVVKGLCNGWVSVKIVQCLESGQWSPCFVYYVLYCTAVLCSSSRMLTTWIHGCWTCCVWCRVKMSAMMKPVSSHSSRNTRSELILCLLSVSHVLSSENGSLDDLWQWSASSCCRARLCNKWVCALCSQSHSPIGCHRLLVRGYAVRDLPMLTAYWLYNCST